MSGLYGNHTDPIFNKNLTILALLLCRFVKTSFYFSLTTIFVSVSGGYGSGGGGGYNRR